MMHVEWGNALSVRKKQRIQRNDTQALLWADQVRPLSSSGVVGNQEGVSRMVDWFRRNQTDPMVVTGDTGIGKTTAVRLVAEEEGFTVVEACANVERSAKFLDRLVREVSMHAKAVLVLDELDAFFDQSHQLKKVRSLMREYPCRMILISTGLANHPQISSILKLGFHVHFSAPCVSDVLKVLGELRRRFSRDDRDDKHDDDSLAHRYEGNLMKMINQAQFEWRLPEKMRVSMDDDTGVSSNSVENEQAETYRRTRRLKLKLRLDSCECCRCLSSLRCNEHFSNVFCPRTTLNLEHRRVGVVGLRKVNSEVFVCPKIN